MTALNKKGMNIDGTLKHNKYGIQIEIETWESFGIVPDVANILDSVYTHFQIGSPALMHDTARIIADHFGAQYTKTLHFDSTGTPFLKIA